MLWAIFRYFPLRALALIVFPFQVTVFLTFLIGTCGGIAALVWFVVVPVMIGAVLDGIDTIWFTLPISRRRLGRLIWYLLVVCGTGPFLLPLVLCFLKPDTYPLIDYTPRPAPFKMILFIASIAIVGAGAWIALHLAPMVQPRLISMRQRLVGYVFVCLIVGTVGTGTLAFLPGVPQVWCLRIELLFLVPAAGIALYYLVLGYRRSDLLVALESRFEPDDGSDMPYGSPSAARFPEFSEVMQWSRWRQDIWPWIVLSAAFTGILVLELYPGAFGGGAFLSLAAFAYMENRVFPLSTTCRLLRCLPLEPREIVVRISSTWAFWGVRVFLVMLCVSVVLGRLEWVSLGLALVLAFIALGILRGAFSLAGGPFIGLVPAGLVIAAFFLARAYPIVTIMLAGVILPLSVALLHAAICNSSRAYRPRREGLWREPGE